MKAIVISDTHLKSPERLTWLTDKHKDASMIIHAGDYTDDSVIKFLQSQKAFIGVWGSVDSDQINSTLPEKRTFPIASYQVGLYHGHGTGGTTADRALRVFANEKVDIIIFGHSHQPCIFTRDKILLLNPGSITAKRKERWFSYIVLDLEPTGISARLVFLNDC